MTAPIVTALITVYNEEEWIETAVRSLEEQTLSDIEILVIDDGSTDSTPQILANRTDARLRVIRLSRSGRAAALAFGVNEARGRYVANLDADDEALPKRLEIQAAFLDAHPKVGWVGSGEERVDSQRGEHVDRLYPEKDEDIRLLASKCIPYSHSAIMLRREMLDHGLNYDPNCKYLIDFEFFLRVAQSYNVANLPEVLVRRRVRDRSYFQSRFGRQEQNRALARLGVRAVKEFGLPIWRYVFPLMRLCYPMIPNSAKRLVRMMQGLKESEVKS